eukprot:COSAG06_NODE_12863_length_1319_cov_1.013934_2_plen_95_part_00
MEAGDALIFVDSVVHGSTIRQIPGARRNILVSYGPDPEKGWRAPPALFERCVHPSCVSAAAAAACAWHRRVSASVSDKPCCRMGGAGWGRPRGR